MDIKQYPYLEDRDGGIPYAEPGELFGDDVNPGWKSLFQKMCDRINVVLDRYEIPRDCFHFDQVKEKFGTLTVYWHVEYPDWMRTPECDAPQDALSKVIDAVEITSGKTCHKCGRRAGWHSTGWILPYCTACATAYNREANERHKTEVRFLDAFVPFPKD